MEENPMSPTKFLVAFAFGLAGCAAAVAQPVTVFSRIYIAPGREAEAAARMEKLIAFVAEREPEVVYQFYRARSNPLVLLTYEVFPSREVAQRHVKEILPAAQASLGPAPEGLFAKPAESEIAIPLAH
jgi:quinol monooxygenase YgiN